MAEHNPVAAAGKHLEELEEDAEAEQAEMEVEEEIEDYRVNRVDTNWTNSNGGFIREKNWPRPAHDQNYKKMMHHIFDPQKITTNENHTGHLFGDVARSQENRIVNGYEAGVICLIQI